MGGVEVGASFGNKMEGTMIGGCVDSCDGGHSMM
jgi:hypothetical protein